MFFDDHLRKKDDDAGRDALLPTSRTRLRRRVLSRHWKRLLLGCLAALGVYVFVKNMPTDVPIRDRRRPVYHFPGEEALGQLAQEAQVHAQQAPQGQAKTQTQTQGQDLADGYEGELRFAHLGASLRVLAATRGGFQSNKNVLFAAASAQSLAALLPLACAMGAEQRNHVHVAVMGRTTATLAHLQAVHAIDDACRVVLHDARPDHAATSSPERLANSVDAAMAHITLYMHPQAVLVDGSDDEEAFFRHGMAAFAAAGTAPVVWLPEHATSRLAWLARLDSASLASWHRAAIDLVVPVPPGADGSLRRLLHSLARADLAGVAVPHLTIDLPASVDDDTLAYLAAFQWPPAPYTDAAGTRQLTLRRRLPSPALHASEDESVARFVESFWPASPAASHVLVLSPQTELAPGFLHYATLTLLEYRYASPPSHARLFGLFGISLDLPRTTLAGTPYTPPTTPDDTAFLWTAPNSNAMLVLGERWAELHRFVAHTLARRHDQPAQSAQPAPAKQVSTKYPAWLELALQLCRARGYWTLYPSAAAAAALATVHADLFHAPDEYAGVDADAQGDRPDDAEVRLGHATLADVLRVTGGLPRAPALPLLAWDGTASTPETADAAASAYRDTFRISVGGCTDDVLASLAPDVLFCV